MKRSWKFFFIAVGMIFGGIGGFLIWGYLPVSTFEPLRYEVREPDYWPTTEWRYSTPEEQGMNSELLLKMIEKYDALRDDSEELYIDSMTVIRNGYIVAEFYNNPHFRPGNLHIIHSATKSIVSALVGIAIDRGYLEGVEVPVVDIFADRTIKNLDEWKRRMTVQDLLSMETGLHSRDSFVYRYEGLFAIQHADDWLQFALDLPMAAEPGSRFDYSNISTFLLSQIVAKSTGMDTLDFAKKYLFEPLGIQDVKWEWNAQGQAIAWARMWLKPNDMAKIGLLFLQQGRWENQQIISASWVQESLTPFAYPQNPVDILNADKSKNQEATMQNWVAQRFVRPFSDGYGYQWWLEREGYFCALGTGGQFIMVAPDENLVFVVTSKSSGMAQFSPVTLFKEYVLPGVESEEALAAKPESQAKLVRRAQPPEPSQNAIPVPKLPEISQAISGVTYAMESNPYKTDNLRFEFDPEKDYAEISYTARENWKLHYQIGLDNVYRFSETNDGTVAAIGRWTSAKTFELDVEIVGYSTFDKWEFSFEGDELEVIEHSISGKYQYRGRAK